MKKWIAFFIALTLVISAGIPVLAAPDVGEDYTFDDLARFTEYYYDDFFQNRDIWEREDGESMDPKDIPEGQEYVGKSYVDAFKEKADELWAVGDAGDEAKEQFNELENTESRKSLYEALKQCVKDVEDNIKTGTRPAALDSLYDKLDNAWNKVNSLADSYGDAEDESSRVKNVHVIELKEGETADEAFINGMNSLIPSGHYWILSDAWHEFWGGNEAENMDWVYKTLEECSDTLNSADETGNWESLNGLSEKIDKAAGRIQEMRRFLESHLYPKPEPGRPETPSQPEKSHGQSKDTKEDLPPEIKVNQVKGTDGRTVVSTLAGVYSARQINGIAVITAKEQAEAAAGLQTEGSRLSLYTSDVSGNKELLNVMSDAALLLGANTAGAVRIDLYKIEGSRVSAVRNTQEPLRLVLELPQNMIYANRTFSILVPDGNGGVLEMMDLDQDPATITLDAAVFGLWTIIYR